jgi:hypothetical protein
MGNHANAPREDLSSWLQEVAARPWSSPPPAAPGANDDVAQSSEQLLAYLEQITRRRLRSREDIRRFAAEAPEMESQAWRRRVRWSIFRQTAVLSVFALAFLQFYFLDVNLQIQSLHSVTVFVPSGPPPRVPT